MLLAVCQATGWDSDLIPRVASGLGGGVGLQGEVCGALTGAVLVVGLTHGRDQACDQHAKEAAHAKAGQVVQRFAEVNGAIRCRDLIGLDVREEEGLQAYYARNLQAKRCNRIVTNAVRVLLELLDEWDAAQP